MIRYALKCPNGHRFESWFQSATGFDRLQATGHVCCPECGAAEVAKDLMTPKVRPARKKPAAQAPEDTPQVTVSEEEMALAKLKAKIEAESDYVGKDFAKEARAMHDGTAPERSIYGETRLDEAQKLIEEGVPIAPLPFKPRRKMN